jgi:hypothetical protein
MDLQRHIRLMESAKCPKAACAAFASFISSGAWPHAGQASKKSPGIRASLRGETVLDQPQLGQV